MVMCWVTKPLKDDKKEVLVFESLWSDFVEFYLFLASRS